MLRSLILFVFAFCLAYPAWGEEAAKKKEAKPEPGTSVEIRLMAPMTQDGNLLGYNYVTSKLICASPAACIAVREKFAFIQDAFVRELHAKPTGLATDAKQIDKDQLNVRLTAVAKRIVGSDKVRNMVFVEVKFAPLHPSDSTAEVPPPDQAPAAPPAGAPAEAAGSASTGGKTASSKGATSKPASGPPH